MAQTSLDLGPVTGILFDLITVDGGRIACATLDSAFAVAQRPSVQATHVQAIYGHAFGRSTFGPPMPLTGTHR